ncbi:MAG: hypothetical protein ACRDTR_11290 [Rubrobacter sp.]
MIRASLQVSDEKDAFSITVCAENLQRAVEFAANRYPGHAVSLLFPLNPEAFFVEGSCPNTETVGLTTDCEKHNQGRDGGTGTRAARRRQDSPSDASKGQPVRKQPAAP